MIYATDTLSVGGQIAHFGLQQWWLSLMPIDRQALCDAHEKLVAGSVGGGGEMPLATGYSGHHGKSADSLLMGLAMVLNRPQTRQLAIIVIEKAEEIAICSNSPIIDLHFIYGVMQEIYYRTRESSTSGLNKTIEACQKQIALSSKSMAAIKRKFSSAPSHPGYKQLAIIYEKQGLVKEAITLCQRAKKQGWHGDWDKRIDRYQRKLAKSKGE